MANLIKFGPLSLFCALSVKFLALGGKDTDVAALFILGLIVGLEKYISHNDVATKFNQELDSLKEEIKYIREKQDSLNSAVASVRLAQGFRPSVGVNQGNGNR